MPAKSASQAVGVFQEVLVLLEAQATLAALVILAAVAKALRGSQAVRDLLAVVYRAI